MTELFSFLSKWRNYSISKVKGGARDGHTDVNSIRGEEVDNRNADFNVPELQTHTLQCSGFKMMGR